MSSLMVSNDLDIMMLEFAVDKLFVPKTSIFDEVIMKKTTVMFRMLDYDWTAVTPHRTDYARYQGSNLEEENFHGGKSIVFAIPSATLECDMRGVDIQIHVRKNISRYFEMDSCRNVGIALVNVDDLFNGIIREIQEREELEEYLSCLHKREPISRSLKGSYEVLDEEKRKTGAWIELYVRLSYFGKSVITEIETGCGICRAFYAQEETNERYPYQCKELRRSDLEGGCWGSKTFLSPVRPDRLSCHCDTWDGVYEQTDDRSDYDDDDDEKGNRGGDSRGSQRAGKERKYSGERRSTDDRGRRSNGDKNGHGKGKLGGKSGKKHRVSNTIVENDGGVGDTKKEPAKRNGMSEKDAKGGGVIKGDDRTREKDSPGVGILRDGIGIFKEENESRKDVDTRADDDRGEDAVEIERKTGTKRKKMRHDGGSIRLYGRRRGKSTDDDDKTSGKARGRFGTGQKGGKTGGAYVDESRGKKKTDGINATTRKVEKLETVKDEGTKGDAKDQKPLGESRDRRAVTPTIAADDVGSPEASTIDPKQALVDAGGSMPTSERIKRREQLRKRRRGVVTVGFDDKEKKICQETLALPVPEPPSHGVTSTMPLQICPNLQHRSPYCYTWPSTGNALLYLPQACFMDTRRERSDRLFAGFNPGNVAELEVLTN